MLSRAGALPEVWVASIDALLDLWRLLDVLAGPEQASMRVLTAAAGSDHKAALEAQVTRVRAPVGVVTVAVGLVQPIVRAAHVVHVHVGVCHGDHRGEHHCDGGSHIHLPRQSGFDGLLLISPQMMCLSSQVQAIFSENCWRCDVMTGLDTGIASNKPALLF